MGSRMLRQALHEGGEIVKPRHRLPLPRINIPGTYFYESLNRSQCNSAAGRIMSMKKSSNTIRNRARDLPACSVVHQPTAPPRVSCLVVCDY